MKSPARPLVLLAVVLSLSAEPRCQAVLANAWHIPDNTNDLGFNMRNPEFEIGPATSITIYSGEQKFNNSFGTANQTGGAGVFKHATPGKPGTHNPRLHLTARPPAR